MTSPVSSNPLLLLRTLGKACLDGATPALASRRKELTLLAFLARRAPRPASRAELASLLWEDRAETKARQSLRQALLDLKRLLNAGLVLDGDSVRLESGLRVDTQAFEEALAAGDPAAAVAWWRGDFLAEMDDVGGEAFRGWVEAEREGLRRQLALAFQQLVRDAEARGDRAAQLRHAERWAELRPTDEPAQRAVVESLAAAGRPAEARARHAAAALRLRAELDADPTPAFTRLGERLARVVDPPDSRRIGSAALFTPDLIGRGDALAELRAAWAAVCAGARITVLVEGDPGIGKSRLCDDFLSESGVGAAAVLLATHGRRSAGAADPDVLRQLLAPLAGAPGLGGAGRPALATVSELVPEVRQRFPDLPLSPPPASALGAAIAEVLGAVADERPVILYLDDLGALDGTSRSALTTALGVGMTGTLALVTARSEDADGPSDLARVRSLPGVRRLTLAALSVRQVDAMLDSMLALNPLDRAGLAARLHEEGGGNPSYTVEMVSALVEDGSLTASAAGTWQLSAMAERPLPLSRTLRDAVGRRIELLAPDRQTVLEVAAVLGRVFRRDLLAMVSEREVWAIESALGDLLTRRLVRRVAGADDTFEFVNELVPRVAYERVTPARRAELHRAAASAWRAHRGEPDAPAAIAYHAARARSAGRRRRWGWRAGAGAGALVAGVALLTGMWAMGPHRRATLATLLTRPAATLEPNRIVVAPLVNRTGDSTLAPIGDMAADWIARGLTQTAQFQVVDPRTAWLTAKLITRMPRLLRPAEMAVGIAEETGSGLVVSGSYYREGDSLRFEVQITDVASHKLTRALNPVSAPIGDASSVIPTLARRTVATVATAVDTQSTGMAAGLSQPPSYQAYDEMGRAWESFWRGDTTDVFRRTARASVLDSSYMPPRLMEAYVRSLWGQWLAVDSIVQVVERHRSRLTPAENAIVDGLQANLRGDRPGRVRAARDLARLTPGSFEGFTLLADMALTVDDPGQSLEALSHVDPDRGFLLLSPIYWQTMAKALHQLGRYDDELKVARQGIRRFPAELGPQVALIRALAALGRAPEAGAEVVRALPGDPELAFDLGYRALTAAAELRTHGHAAEAVRLLGSLRLAAPLGPPTPGDPEVDRLTGDLLYEARRWTDARRRYAEVLARYPTDIESLAGVGVASARLGDSAEARRVDAALAGWPHPFALGRTTYGRARIAAVVGDSASALALVERSFREGFPIVSIWERHVHTELDFDGWSASAPFRALMGLP